MSGAVFRSRQDDEARFSSLLPKHTQSQIFPVTPNSNFRAPRSEVGRLKAQLADCANAGHAARAFRICTQMKQAGIRPDITTYNWLLHACAKQGLASECLALLDDLKALKLKPDLDTYNHVLYVCNYESLVENHTFISTFTGSTMEQELCLGRHSR